ncbi:MAG: ribbon-helix-helix protein, CopG family [Acidobacteria bacterium]|nr:ribbon-helix-helix protein, CopG family [Acidobacteriota bacterium]
MPTERVVRTTVALPADILAAADRAVLEGKARSRNELLADALRYRLTELERAAMAAQFAAMAGDAAYQEEVHQIMAEFSEADAESSRLARSEERSGW